MGKALKTIGLGLLIGAVSFIPGLGPGLAAALLATGDALFISGLLGAAASLFIKKPRRPRPSYNIQYDGTVEPRRIIYGTVKISGMNTIPAWTSGSNNQYLHQVLTLAGHEVDDITDVYFGQNLISDSAIGAISGAPTDGKVASGTYANKAWIRRYLGTSSQTVDYILDTAFSAWGSNHRGRGCAYMALQYELDDTVYQTGPPQPTCIVRGKKCYDPRLDPSPGTNVTNTSYIFYSTNPALCLADYLIDTTIGCKIPTAKIDWTLVIAAANECDENVTTPSGTQRRYTCNVAMYAASDEAERRENISILVGAMMGNFIFRGGKYRMYAGAAQASTFALTESDLVGRISMPTEIAANKKYNYVRGQFVDSARNYQTLEFEPRSSAAYESTDGGRKPREVEFPACTDQYEAQRNAMVILKQSRRKRELTGIWGMSAYDVRTGDVGTITLAEWGWNAQAVRCQSWKFNGDYTIEASFIEEDSTDWNDPIVGDYTTPGAGSGPAASGYTPDSPQNFVVTPIVDGILFSWEPPSVAGIGTSYKIYEYTAVTPFSSATAIATGLTGTSRTVIKTDTTTRYYWITARDYFSGVESTESPIGSGLPGAALTITTGFRATVSPGAHFKLLIGTGSGSTSGSSTVTPINGVSPYTYSWVRFSGSTKITVNSSTAQTTGFSASGLANLEEVDAVFRCTVTDSTGGTPLTTTVDVSVSFSRDDSA